MENDSAAQALSDVRQHCAQIHGLVNDFHQKFQQLEQTTEQRMQGLQQAQEALLAHIGQERDRARQEIQELQHLIQDSTQWLAQGAETIENDAKAFTDDLTTAEHASDADSSVLQQAVEQLLQLAQKAQQDYDSAGKALADQVDHAHAQVHDQFLAGVSHMQQTVSQASQQHEQEVEHAFNNDFLSQQQSAHGQLEQIGSRGSQQMQARGQKLHDDASHEVDTLHQHQDQSHQDLESHVNGLREAMEHVGSTITQTAHGMAGGVDAASTLMQETNLGVEEVLKIIQNIEAIFADIMHAYNS